MNPKAGEDAKILVSAADTALYSAKNLGRNRTEVATAEMKFKSSKQETAGDASCLDQFDRLR